MRAGKDNLHGPKVDFFARSRDRRVLECWRVRPEEGMKEYIALLKYLSVRPLQQPEIVLRGLLRAIEIGVIDQEGMGIEENFLARRAGPQAKVDVVQVGEKAIIEPP
jgi:hypothetical protein